MEERKGFGSNFGFLMAAIGSAVGLGNIWGFPNKMGANGGFTFLIIYLILAVLCGFVVMVGELAIGRKTGKGAIAAYRSLSQRFKWVGWLGVASAFLIMSFYCALGGYCLKYVVLNIGNLTGAAFGSNGLSGSEVFSTFLTSQGEGVIYGLIFVVLTMVIVMGAMITYGSYLDKKEHLEKNATIIVIMDTIIALMAGLCVMPARFALDPTGEIGGPKLLFITMQNVFDSMGGVVGPIFGIIFYLLVVLAAVSSSISLLETVVTHFVDSAAEKGKGDKRKFYSFIASVAIAVLCLLVCMDGLGSNGISPANLLGQTGNAVRNWNDCWLDFFDMISEGVFMPFGGLLMTIMIGWELGPDFVKRECETTPGHKMSTYGFFKICVKFITPLCMVLILYGQIKNFFF